MAVNFQMITRHRSLLCSMRGTSGDLGHPRQSRYRCSLPGLAGFAGPRCTEPEVPRSGSRSSRLLKKILTQLHGGNQRAQAKTALRFSEFSSGIRSGNYLFNEMPIASVLLVLSSAHPEAPHQPDLPN